MSNKPIRLGSDSLGWYWEDGHRSYGPFQRPADAALDAMRHLERQLAAARAEIADYRSGTGMKRSEITRVLGDPSKGVTIVAGRTAADHPLPPKPCQKPAVCDDNRDTS